MPLRITFTVNLRTVSVTVDPAAPCSTCCGPASPSEAGLHHEGECGACTILLDGLPVRVLTPVGKVAATVLTVEGLRHAGHAHPQSAFITHGAVNAASAPAMLLTAKALLDAFTRRQRRLSRR